MWFERDSRRPGFTRRVINISIFINRFFLINILFLPFHRADKLQQVHAQGTSTPAQTERHVFFFVKGIENLLVLVRAPIAHEVIEGKSDKTMLCQVRWDRSVPRW